ncbi:hypothetical protein HY285_04105 [Candidatus Peregrinibacteria bacterium]|nr:hypothetical protein [Candidatus Peregrinibacteria bacterium]MBI3816698.1 hypothetical protein [Candidatus Peregrinibacteria bacterium]
MALVIALGVLGFFSRTLFFGVLLSGMAAYLTTFAIGAGHFLSQHFLLAIPVYAVVFLLFVEKPRFLFLPIVLFLLIPFYHPILEYKKELLTAQQSSQRASEWKPIAKEADDLLYQCNFAQYYALGGAAGIEIFTMHSPTDLAYAEVSDSSELRKRFIERLNIAPVIFTDNTYLQNVDDDDVRTLLQTNFTTEPPSCARATTLNNNRIVVLFRNDPSHPGTLLELPALSLSHFIGDFTSNQSISMQKANTIGSVIRRELGLTNTESQLVLNFHEDEERILITVLDSTKQNVLGKILLNRADGKILSKSARPQSPSQE